MKVGLLVAFGLLFLLWASFAGGGSSIFYTKQELNTVLNTANGLIAGAPVRSAGVEVGKVSEVKLIGRSASEQVFVKMAIEERMWFNIKSDSKATLGTIGMLGDKYLEITPGSTELPPLTPGDFIEGRVAGDLLSVIDKAPEMVGNLQHLAQALGDLATKLEGTEGTIGKLIHSDSLYEALARAGQTASEMLSSMQQQVPSLMTEAENTMSEFGGIARQVQDTSGTVGQLLATRNLHDRLDDISARLQALVADVQGGKGSVGAVLTEDQMYEDLHKTILDMQFLLKDIRENPKRYVTFKVF
jgi:phospholipid/cholesterol/gamma-HCH transport system substrate-binding protein